MAKWFIFGPTAPIGHFWDGPLPPPFKSWIKDGNTALKIDDDLESSGGGIFVEEQSGECYYMNDLFAMQEGTSEIFRYAGYEDEEHKGKSQWRSLGDYTKLIHLD